MDDHPPLKIHGRCPDLFIAFSLGQHLDCICMGCLSLSGSKQPLLRRSMVRFLRRHRFVFWGTRRPLIDFNCLWADINCTTHVAKTTHVVRKFTPIMADNITLVQCGLIVHADTSVATPLRIFLYYFHGLLTLTTATSTKRRRRARGMIVPYTCQHRFQSGIFHAYSLMYICI